MSGSPYAIWLIPPEPLYTQLDDMIRFVAKQYNSPVFTPHVTLISSIVGDENQIKAFTKCLSERLETFTLHLLSASAGEEYYLGAFFEILKSQEIMRANSIARDVFEMRDLPTYSPHLSIMYSRLPIEVKREIASIVHQPAPMKFNADMLHLYSTNGEVNTWTEIERFRLKKK